MTDLARRLAVARGDEPADLVVQGGRVLSVHTREWLEADVAVCDGWIAGVGEYSGRDTLDARGRYVVPGLIDAHLHLESSMLLVDEFAKLVLPFGTTSVVADPHEIANVLGTDGVHWLADACADLPLDVFFMAPSCVPASRFESPRRALTTGDLEGLLRRRSVLGLAEMMNFPGVIAGDPDELAKLGLEGAKHVDGHAPGVLGRRLQAYAAAGIGSDHEATTQQEGRERLRAGMWLLIREASGARNLDALLPLVHEFGPGRIAFCTDDREPGHIAREGHVNSMVRRAVESGVDARDALAMASCNAAAWHGLGDRGAIAPGRRADLLVLPDLERFLPDVVLKDGAVPAPPVAPPVPEWARRTVRIQPISPNDLHTPDERRRDPRDRPGAGPDRDRSAGDAGHRPRRVWPSPTRPATWPRSRSRSVTWVPAGSGSGSCRASGCSAGRSRAPSPTTRTTSSASASTTATWRARSGAWPSWAEAWWPSRAAACGRSCRCRWRGCSATSRWTWCWRRARRCQTRRRRSAAPSRRRSTP